MSMEDNKKNALKKSFGNVIYSTFVLIIYSFASWCSFGLTRDHLVLDNRQRNKVVGEFRVRLSTFLAHNENRVLLTK